MTLGLRCAHVARTPRPKPCKGGCGVVVMTKCAAKYCDACYDKSGGADRNSLHPKYRDMSWAEVDARFQAALAEIRRRPPEERPEPDLRWTSPLAGLKGTGL